MRIIILVVFAALSYIPVIDATVYNFTELVESEKKAPKTILNTLRKYPMLVVRFIKPNCPACHAVDSLFKKVANEFDTETIRFVDIDYSLFQNVDEEIKIKTLPTVVIFVQGHKTASLKGKFTKKDLETAINMYKNANP